MFSCYFKKKKTAAALLYREKPQNAVSESYNGTEVAEPLYFLCTAETFYCFVL